jgi:hypothetical protein
MRSLHQLNKEIGRCISEIENQFPELYQLLEETPIKGLDSDKPVSNEALEDYLNTLKTQLAVFKKK